MKKKFKKISLISLIALIICSIFVGGCSSSSSKNNLASEKAVEGNYIYYSNGSKIYKLDKKTKKKEELLDMNLDDGGRFYGINDLTVDDGYIYCTYDKYVGTDDSWPYIYKVKTNGEKGEFLSKGFSPIIYDGRIYYIKASFDGGLYQDYMEVEGLYSMSLDGSDDTCIKEFSSYVYNFTISNSKIYYVEDSMIRCMELDGNNLEILAKYDYYIDEICSYENKVYFSVDASGYAENGIYCIDTKSNDVTKILSNGYLKLVDDGCIYYTETNYGDDNYYDLYKYDLKTRESNFVLSVGGMIYKIDVFDDKLVMANYYIMDSNMYSDRFNTRLSVFDLEEDREVILEEYFTS